MPSAPHIPEVGSSSTASAPAVSPAAIIALLYESASPPGVDPLARLDLSLLSAREFKKLEELITSRGEILAPADREAFERRDASVVRALLEHIRQKADQLRRTEPQHQIDDGVTQTRAQAPSFAERRDLPAEERDAGHEAPDGRAQRAARQEQRGAREAEWSAADAFAVLTVRPPVKDPAVLAAAKERLGELVQGGAEHKSVEQAVSRKGAGGGARRYCFRDAFPPSGRSGAADKLPLVQFALPRLQKSMEQLGIRTLVDFLVRAAYPDSRLILSRMLGLPEPTLLLAAHRAELLDLPVARGRAKQPHLKDVLLLARLGVGSVRALARLHELFEAQPVRLELLAALIDKLQRADRSSVGRERITRQDLREWAAAAARRGSDVRAGATEDLRVGLAAASAAPPLLLAEQRFPGAARAELSGAAVLSWYLEQRWSDPESAWDEIFMRLVRLLELERVQDEALAERLCRELGQARLESWRAVAARGESEAPRPEFAEWVLDESEPSLFTDLYPWQRPDAERQDRLICFWMDPIPEARHALARGPEPLQAVYVCIDPDSGAVLPQ